MKRSDMRAGEALFRNKIQKQQLHPIHFLKELLAHLPPKQLVALNLFLEGSSFIDDEEEDQADCVARRLAHALDAEEDLTTISKLLGRHVKDYIT